MLDPALHEAVVALVPPEKQVLAKRFLGLRAPAEWRAILADIRDLHRDRIAQITSPKPPVPVLDGGCLVMHVVPFSAVGSIQPRSSDELFRRPDKFPPIGRDRPQDSRISHDGLLTWSNADGLRKPQRAYVHVSRIGVVEAVVSDPHARERTKLHRASAHSGYHHQIQSLLYGSAQRGRNCAAGGNHDKSSQRKRHATASGFHQ